MQEKYEARQKAKPGWQEQKPAALHLKAVLLAKLKLKKFAAAAAARAEQEGSKSCIRETLEISDDEASPFAAAPLPPIPAPEVPAVAEAAKVGDLLVDDAPQELLTRSQQLRLARSKKRKNKKSQDDDADLDGTPGLLKKCLSKCSLSIARKRKERAAKKQAKCKAKAKSCPKPKASAKAKAKASAKAQAKAKLQPKAKAKKKAQIRLPNVGELRHYHGLMKKFKQAREGDLYGAIPKEDRGLLKEKIHASKKLP